MTRPILDRRVEFDDRSRNYDVRPLTATKKPRSYTWRCYARLDQGSEGACVGFAWVHELASRPAVVLGVLASDALDIYRQAQKVDQWPGEDYSGTSVIAGAKIVQTLGYIPEYRWAFTFDDAITTIGHNGPVVLGLNWYEGMWDTDEKGFIRPTGRVVGGHAILANGVSVSNEYVLLTNSWGPRWGFNGQAKLAFEDFDRLRREDGDVCVPLVRSVR